MKRKRLAVWLCMLAAFCMLFAGGYSTVSAETNTVADTMNLSAKTKAKVTVYKKAGTTTGKVVTLNKNQELWIRGELTVSGKPWYRIQVTVGKKTYKGYLQADKVKKFNIFAKVSGKVNTSANMRQGKSVSAKSITVLPPNKAVTVLGSEKGGKYTWYKITAKVNGKTKTGYVVSKYVTLSKTTAGSIQTMPGAVTAKNGLYKTANTNDQKLNTIPKGAEVLILAELQVDSVNWLKVKTIIGTKVYTGYVMAKYVSQPQLEIYGTPGEGTLVQKYTLKKVPNALGTEGKTLAKDSKVIIIGIMKVGKMEWYLVATGNDTGYIIKSMLSVSAEPKDPSTEPDYDIDLSVFPSSYRPGLQALKDSHPKWVFVPVNTGLLWDTVVQNENVVGRNTIQSNYPKGGSSLAPFSYLSTAEGAYDWATDTYKVKDGSNWYAANEQVISYYLDPRNFLTVGAIYQFEALSFDKNHNKTVLNAILKGTFMEGSFSVVDKLTDETVTGEYNTTFMEAGQAANASPYFLARTARLEVGAKGSKSVTGDHATYPGIYNFYNIGAYDSASGNAVTNGLKWASGGSNNATTYGRPWTTPAKSIKGGAEYIAGNYISKGQNTSYFKKFNVVNRTSGLYSHQYATNVQAAVAEASVTKNAYDQCNMEKEPMIFYIPVYTAMPKENCKLPEVKGNPNYYLKDIIVEDASGKTLSMNKTFNYKVTEYSMAVSGLSSVKISAPSISKYASVTINGTQVSSSSSVTVRLTAGQTTTVEFVCTAGNGDTLTYMLSIAASK